MLKRCLLVICLAAGELSAMGLFDMGFRWPTSSTMSAVPGAAEPEAVKPEPFKLTYSTKLTPDQSKLVDKLCELMFDYTIEEEEGLRRLRVFLNSADWRRSGIRFNNITVNDSPLLQRAAQDAINGALQLLIAHGARLSPAHLLRDVFVPADFLAMLDCYDLQTAFNTVSTRISEILASITEIEDPAVEELATYTAYRSALREKMAIASAERRRKK